MITLMQDPETGGLAVTMTKRGHAALVSIVAPDESMLLAFPGLDVRLEVSNPKRARGPRPSGAFYDEAVELIATDAH
jgi:hypothetical protein